VYDSESSEFITNTDSFVLAEEKWVKKSSEENELASRFKSLSIVNSRRKLLHPPSKNRGASQNEMKECLLSEFEKLKKVDTTKSIKSVERLNEKEEDGGGALY